MQGLNTEWLRDHGTICPTQASGEAPNGQHVYARYRYGTLTVSINSETMFSQSIGDGMDGCMDIGKMKEIAYHVWASYDLIDQVRRR